MKKRALFSLYTLDKVEEFSQCLIDLGWEIIATRETSKILLERGLSVVEITEFTGINDDFGFPPTLHPKIEAQLTKDSNERIDLVYVIPYPLSVGNDVGGRTLLALAAKGKRIPVMSVSDMELVVGELKKNNQIPDNLHEALINKAYALIANHYDDLIVERKKQDLIIGNFQYTLLNGENPYQVPAAIFSLKENGPLSLHKFKQLSGQVPCFTNLADADSILHTLCLTSEAFYLRYKKLPYICIAAKHGNACGMAIDWHTPEEVINRALLGNPQSIWGGELIVNFDIDEQLANILFKSKQRQVLLGDSHWMLDLILAPAFSAEAINILGRRKNRKIFENKALSGISIISIPWPKYVYRFVRGGFLRQPPNNFILDFAQAEIAGTALDSSTVDSLIVAWAVAWSSNHGGNEVAVVKESQLLGAGGGPSTFEATSTAITRANHCGHDLKEAIFAANAFFPFIDAPQVFVDSGLKAGLVPSGGKQAALIKTFFKTKGLTMVYLPDQYRGFCRH